MNKKIDINLDHRSALLLFWFQFLLWFGINLVLFFYFVGMHLSFFEWVKVTYGMNTIFFPIFFLVVSVIILWNNHVRLREKKMVYAGWVGIGLALFIFGIRCYASYIEPYNLHVQTVTIESPKLHDTIRVLHISDIQSDTVGWYEEKVFQRMAELQPDLIIHTGDLLHPVAPATIETEIPKIAALFRSLECPMGIYGVPGDTDWSFHTFSQSTLGGYRILKNESITLSHGKSQLNIMALSLDQSEDPDRRMIEEWISNAEPDEFTLLIGHRPDYILKINDLPIDLCLAGHTHGGQIVIPLYGPVTVASEIPKEWARGFREVGNTRLNVSACIGCEHSNDLPDMRFFCPPEMTLFELISSISTL